jgi:CBS domain-containing protein
MNGDSSIKLRVFSFFKQLYPFSYFNGHDLEKIAENVKISVYKKNELVFCNGDKPKEYFFVIKKGAVRIEKVTNEIGFLIDKCGEGDMFGIRSILADANYIYNAIVLEDSIIYEVPAAMFAEIYPKYPKAANFVIQKLTVNQIVQERNELNNSDVNPIVEQGLILRTSEEKDLIVTNPDSAIQSAINKMNKYNVSSIIAVNEDFIPIGILTDRDIRNYVASGYDGNKSLSSIMSTPVKCISPLTTLAEVQLSMIDSGFHHLCITQDGTNQTKCVGIVTEHDILYAGATDPVVVLKKIKAAQSISALKDARKKIDRMIRILIHEDINRKTVLAIIDQLNRTLIQKVVSFSLSEQKALHQKVDNDCFSFFTMGSAARGEQSLMTDQDNGIIILDDQSHFKEAYLSLGKKINQYLSEIGYELCPADMMAGNPDWCLTQSEYKENISKWIMDPGPEEVLNTSIFFDFRHEFGNEKIVLDLKKFILETLAGQDVYLRFLAVQAANNPPPTSFFRNFVVEKNGEHKDMFDIKGRAISPLADIARLLALKNGFLTSSSTIKRYEFLKKADEGNMVLYDAAIEAFLELMIIRVESVLKDQDHFIEPEALNKLQRIKLRQCFEPIKKLLGMIERNFQLAYLR